MKIVDLADYRRHGAAVFAGRDRGIKVRKASGLDTLDDDPDVVEVRIPRDVFSISSSFFLGLFGASVRKLGPDGFKEHYRFVGPNMSHVIDEGIKEAVKRRSPLSQATAE